MTLSLVRWVALGGVVFGASLSFAADINPPTLHSRQGAWPIHRQWTLAETRHFADWIQHIYDMKSDGTREQRLAKLERVLTGKDMNLLLNPEFAGDGCNPQLELSTIRTAHGVLDCAKLTVALSAYYAYTRGLPWMVSFVRAPDGSDVRTAEYTLPVGGITSLEYDSADRFFRDALTGVCTGNFRVEMGRKNSELSDTVPVAITREALVPGSLYYLDGHVLFVGRITPDGEPRFLDATTSETRDIYAYNGFNAVSGLTPKQSGAGGSAYASCYRGFRVFRWPVAVANGAGEVTGVRRRSDDEMKEFGYSPEQYDVLERLTTKQPVIEQGAAVEGLEQFIRLRLRAEARTDVVAALHAFTDEMLAALKDREKRVQHTWQEVKKNGPIAYPEERANANVFTAGGRWGEHASALSDAALRAKYFALLDRLDAAVAWFDARTGDVDLTGFNTHAIWNHADLAEALLRAKNSLWSSVTFEYTNSAGKPVTLSLLDVERRIFDLSFDPNQPPELRWGAKLGSPEAASAIERGTPLPDGTAMPMAEAYRREAYYRSLAHWAPEPSYLRSMFTEGFSLRDTLDEHLRQRWFDSASPPLVPHGGRAAWLKEQGAVTPR